MASLENGRITRKIYFCGRPTNQSWSQPTFEGSAVDLLCWWKVLIGTTFTPWESTQVASFLLKEVFFFKFLIFSSIFLNFPSLKCPAGNSWWENSPVSSFIVRVKYARGGLLSPPPCPPSVGNNTLTNLDLGGWNQFSGNLNSRWR